MVAGGGGNTCIELVSSAVPPTAVENPRSTVSIYIMQNTCVMCKKKPAYYCALCGKSTPICRDSPNGRYCTREHRETLLANDVTKAMKSANKRRVSAPV